MIERTEDEGRRASQMRSGEGSPTAAGAAAPRAAGSAQTSRAGAGMGGLPHIGLETIGAARERISGATRRTPMMAAEPMRPPIAGPGRLSFKLEFLQATGSFKARGAVNRALALPPTQRERGLITASGGNHGLAVAYAGATLAVPTVIYLPETVDRAKVDKLAHLGAEVLIEGAFWDQSNRAALARAEAEGLAYIHPFADPDVIAGQGTIGLEIVEDAPDIDVLLVAIGGGGLISGVAVAAKAMKPDLRIVGVEPVGAPTLKRSLEHGDLVTLERVDTAAVTLAAGRTEPINFEIIRQNVDEIVLVCDEEMREAARWLWQEFGIGAELSGAATVAALRGGRLALDGENVCALICGVGSDGWR